jgi:H+/gluconate symporter-like permease
MAYLEWCRRRAAAAGEGYGAAIPTSPNPSSTKIWPTPLIAILPLVVVGVMNKVFTDGDPGSLRQEVSFIPAVIGKAAPVVQQTKAVAAIWAVEGALLVGILTVIIFAWKTVTTKFAEGSKGAIGGALLATMNTASEYGFGAVIAACRASSWWPMP